MVVKFWFPSLRHLTRARRWLLQNQPNCGQKFWETAEGDDSLGRMMRHFSVRRVAPQSFVLRENKITLQEKVNQIL